MRTCACVDIAVVGAGPAGLATALALAADGAEVAVVAPPPTAVAGAIHGDPRTTALFPSSIAFLENVGAWEGCAKASAPLLGIRIVDDRSRMLRAPEVLFRAADVELPSFGANVALPTLSGALVAAVEHNARIRWQPTTRVTTVSPQEGVVRVALAEGDTLLARLVVGADGANSVAREGAGIGKRTWTYPQAAIAGTIVHSRAQDGITTELHRRSGPLTIVPLGDDRSSFVWVEEPGETQRLAHLPEDGFCDALAFRLQGLLGSLRAAGPRATFPLRGLRAACMGRARVALVGEAAHVVAPIGAQGFNLSLRDAAHLADCVLDARVAGEDIGALRTLAAYEEKRRADVESRTLLVDLLNRSLLSDVLPLSAARGVGLHLLANFPLLRRWAIAGGLHSPGQMPRLMHGATLGTGKSHNPGP
jgi:2-octaprenyl-6-methoxyphenol hydroxylase